ncbi:hypothetical protein Ddc_18161 [Ditylenchus destructor]|nr:hypothetical protein Ddc_18161 [Ditylenchus destructor]
MQGSIFPNLVLDPEPAAFVKVVEGRLTGQPPCGCQWDSFAKGLRGNASKPQTTATCYNFRPYKNKMSSSFWIQGFPAYNTISKLIADCISYHVLVCSGIVLCEQGLSGKQQSQVDPCSQDT